MPSVDTEASDESNPLSYDRGRARGYLHSKHSRGTHCLQSTVGDTEMTRGSPPSSSPTPRKGEDYVALSRGHKGFLRALGEPREGTCPSQESRKDAHR